MFIGMDVISFLLSYSFTRLGRRKKKFSSMELILLLLRSRMERELGHLKSNLLKQLFSSYS
jgi:hypothetical protein